MNKTERKAMLATMAEKISKAYPHLDSKSFIEHFVKMIEDLDTRLDPRLDQFEAEVTPLVGNILLYQPIHTAIVVEEYRKLIGEWVDVVVQSLASIRMRSIRLDIVDTYIDALKEVRNTVMDIEPSTPKAS